MVKVSIIESSPSATTLLIEGKIVGEAVDEVSGSCEQALAEGRRLTLDLAGVSFIDRVVVALFHRLAARQSKRCKLFGIRCRTAKNPRPGIASDGRRRGDAA